MHDPRDVALGVLGLGFLLFFALYAGERGWLEGAPPADLEAVRLIDTVLDRDDQRTLDLFFDRPIGRRHLGEIAADPVRIRPHLGGVWTWRGDNILRFRATGRFAPATRYELELLPDGLLGPDQRFAGETRVAVVTDAFRVDRLAVGEVSTPAGRGEVRLRGTLFFNEAVHPGELAPRLTLRDPEAREPIPVTLEPRHASAAISWISEPLQKGGDERTLRLRVAESLTAAEGNLSLGEAFETPIALGSRDRLALRSATAHSAEDGGRVSLLFSSAIDPERAAAALVLDPAIEVRAHREGNAVVLRGAFAPGTRYGLALPAGLEALDGSQLVEASEHELVFPDLAPALDFEGRGMLLAARGERSLGVRSVNVERVELRIERVYRNNLLFLFEREGHLVWNERAGYRSLGAVYGDEIARQTLALDAPRNRSHLTRVPLDPYLVDAEPGLYRVTLGREGHPYERRQRWVLLSDLGIVVKTSGEDLLVWVSSFADQRPVAGARVTMWSAKNQLLAEGRTDAAGLLHLRDLDAALEDTRVGLVTAERGDDWSFVPGTRARIDTARFDVGGATRSDAAYEAFLYSERDLYRPGETLRGVAILRDVRAATLEPAPAMPLLLRPTDPSGRRGDALRLQSDASGTSAFELAIPSYARTGVHRLELVAGDTVVGDYRYQVEEFVPDRIRVDIDPGPSPAPGAALHFSVEGTYLFGPPAASLRVETRATLEAASFAPAGFADFVFADPERGVAKRTLLETDGVLDAAGRAVYEVALPADLRAPASLVARLESRVQEEGGRGVTARDQVRVHPVPYYLGLRSLGADGHTRGDSVELEFVRVAPDGDEVEGGPLRAALYRKRWHTVLRRTSHGSYRYETERELILVEERALPEGRARGRLTFRPDRVGSYDVVVEDPSGGAATRVSFYTGGWGYAPWALEDPSRIELALDRGEYAVGGNAAVQVRAPFAGTLLLAVEGSGVHHAEVHRLDGNTGTFRVPIRQAFRPSAYVTATLVRSPDAVPRGGVARAFGAVPLVVDRAKHRMALTLRAPTSLRPGDPLEVAVETTPGARVTIAAVDEGILQLVGQASADPFAFFYRKRALGVATHDNYGLLLPEIAKANAGGGRGRLGPADFVRTEGMRRAEAVALWSGVLEADPGGNARAAFTVPEFQGTLRLMAVAHRAADFGSAQREVQVRSPIVLLPTAPRAVAPGDVFAVALTVRNDTGAAGEFAVGVRTEGPANLDTPMQRLSLGEGAETTLSFPVSVGAGTASIGLALWAEGNGERSERRLDLGAPRPDLPPIRRGVQGTLAEARTVFDATVESEFQGGVSHRVLRVSRFPLVAYAGKLGDLVRYPYGCLEQTTSKAFPMVYLGALARRLDPALFATRDPDAMVAMAIRRIQSMALPQGGFGLWPDASSPDRWASIYATHFLVEAERAGHAVASHTLGAALDFVAAEARAGASGGGGARDRAAYALFVLGRAGRPDRGAMELLRRASDGATSPRARALLAATYAASGHTERIDELLRGAAEQDVVRRETGGNYGSPLRDRALVLLAMLDAAPDDPRVLELAARIARDADGPHSWTTQESAFALLALGELFRRQATRPSVGGSIRVDGREIERFDGEIAVVDPVPTGTLAIEMDPGFVPGTAFFSLEARGVPRPEHFAEAADGIEIERSLTGPGGADQAAGFVQGDLVRLRLRVRATESRVDNVVVSQLLPAGLEVENPRLATTGGERIEARHLDIRDDRLLLFVDLPHRGWQRYDVLLRAVTSGVFRMPPVQAEAMYDAALRATGPRGHVAVRPRP